MRARVMSLAIALNSEPPSASVRPMARSFSARAIGRVDIAFWIVANRTLVSLLVSSTVL